jgi:hypothetical protein
MSQKKIPFLTYGLATKNPTYLWFRAYKSSIRSEVQIVNIAKKDPDALEQVYSIPSLFRLNLIYS